MKPIYFNRLVGKSHSRTKSNKYFHSWSRNLSPNTNFVWRPKLGERTYLSSTRNKKGWIYRESINDKSYWFGKSRYETYST